MGTYSVKNLLIRADGNSQIGTGHVMRCLALAQAWQEAQDTAHFVLANPMPALEARLLAEGMPIYHITTPPGSSGDAEQTVTLAQQIKTEWLIVDGYHFDTAYQQAVKAAGLRLLFIDDYGHANHYHADLVLNQNIYANESIYANRKADTRLLLGPRYALLRCEFWPWRNWRREIPAVARKVLVTLGGTDSDNVTRKVIQALSQIQLEAWEAVVVVGGSNPHWDTLQAAVAHSTPAIRLERNVKEMPSLMAWADLAISAGGSTCLELAFMGLPNLILILADNQQLVAKGLDTVGVSINLGDAVNLAPIVLAQALTEMALAPEQRAVMARRGQELVDGFGAARIVREMQNHNKLALRPVQADDCHLIWEWVNDPATRANSFSTAPIPWERHRNWFMTKLADPQSRFYLALDSVAAPIGQIRYQIEGQTAVVSVSLAPNQRGRGYSDQIIQLASQQIFENTAVKLIHAYIKPDNVASIRAFTKAGFVSGGTTEMEGHSALHFVLRKGVSL